MILFAFVSPGKIDLNLYIEAIESLSPQRNIRFVFLGLCGGPIYLYLF